MKTLYLQAELHIWIYVVPKNFPEATQDVIIQIL